MFGIILYQNEKGDLYRVKNSAFDEQGIVHLDEGNIEKTTVDELAKNLAPQYGVDPDDLDICLFDAMPSFDKTKLLATSYKKCDELTQQLRKAITNYVSSWVDPDLSPEILQIKKIKKEFGITPEKHRTIIDIVKRLAIYF